MHAFIESKLTALSSIFLKHKVKAAFLFGSACTDAFNENSDIDFLIELHEETDPLVKGENLWDLYDTLKAFLGREVDLITRESLTNQYFISEINRNSIQIYGWAD